MTEKERIESQIATCKCCMLAQVMKECPTCLFNIGLVEQQVKQTELIPLPVELQAIIFEPA